MNCAMYFSILGKHFGRILFVMDLHIQWSCGLHPTLIYQCCCCCCLLFYCVPVFLIRSRQLFYILHTLHSFLNNAGHSSTIPSNAHPLSQPSYQKYCHWRHMHYWILQHGLNTKQDHIYINCLFHKSTFSLWIVPSTHNSVWHLLYILIYKKEKEHRPYTLNSCWVTH